MVAGPSKEQPDYIIQTDNQRLLKTSLIYGANSSGKSNFVKGFMYSRMRAVFPSKDHFSYGIDSFRDYAHIDGSGKRSDEPSYFEYILMLNDRIFSFGFEIETFSSTIMSEWLVEILEDGTEKIIYAIELKEDYRGIDDLYNLYTKYAGESRQESFLHFAEKLEYSGLSSDIIIGLAKWFRFGLIVIPSSIDDCLVPVDEEFISNLEHELNALDVSVTLITEKDKSEIERRNRKYGSDLTCNCPRSNNILINLNSKVFNKIQHTDLMDITYQIKFYHKKGGMTLSFDRESEGTCKIIMLLTLLHSSYEGISNTIILDEIESNLHTLVCKAIVERFISGRYECKQFIFTTHETRFMENDSRPDIFWFVDSSRKEYTNESSIYSLEEFKDVTKKTLNEDYLNGVYGGIPFIKEF